MLLKRPPKNRSVSKPQRVKSWLIAILLLLLIAIPIGIFLDALHRDQAGHDLIQAIKRNDTASALVALKQGADPNVRDKSKDESPSFSDRVNQLFDHFFHPRNGQYHDTHPTALFLLEFGQDDNSMLTQALLEAGADPNATGEKEQSPLMLAVMLRHSQSVHLLLKQRGQYSSEG